MEGKFDVILDGQAVGTVELRREGLYCRISCRCQVFDDQIHRLYADGEKLGVLIPECGTLSLTTKVAAKRLKPGCAFTIGESRGMFIPIYPGETFEHLDRVRSGHMAFRDGQTGLMVK